MFSNFVISAICCYSTFCLVLSEPLSFPKDFAWGVSTSAYQIEGAWNVSGKGKSIWDVLVHQETSVILDGSTGDVACDSYHKYKEDVQMMKYLGISHYRFSLSWTRLLPDGFRHNVNQAGVDYYNNLINELLANGIQPVVTLHHFDPPATFTILGLWTNDVIVEAFADYARLAFTLFGDRVKLWITFNEPKVFCIDFAYAIGNYSDTYPTGHADYLCIKNILKSHAEAYHIYNNEFKRKQRGKVSITLNFDWSEPASDSDADQKAAETTRQFEFGIFANAIINGGFPKVVRERIEKRSLEEGFPRSRLPKLSLLEWAQIKGTYDFLGVNHYFSNLVRASPEAPTNERPTFYKDMGTIKYQDPSWPGNEVAPNNKVAPWGLRHALKWIKKTYKNVDVYITECGWPDKGGIQDPQRIDYLEAYINATRQAIVEDGAKVKGFFAWSLMDNMEWGSGYTIKFGLYQVDFDDDSRPRTPRDSAAWYKTVVENNAI